MLLVSIHTVWSRQTALLAVTLSVLAGCRAPSGRGAAGGPLPVSEVDLRTSCYRGSALSGPVPAVPRASEEKERLFAVRVVVHALEGLPEGILEPLSASSRLILATTDTHAVSPTTRLGGAVRVGFLTDESRFLELLTRGMFGREAPVLTRWAALKEGVTTSLRLERRIPREAGTTILGGEEMSSAGDAASRIDRLEILLCPVADSGQVGEAEVAIHMQGVLREALYVVERSDGAWSSISGGAEPATESLTDPESPVELREMAVLEPRLQVGGSPLAVIFPSPTDLEGIGAFVAVVAVEPVPEAGESGAAGFQEAVTRCEAELEVLQGVLADSGPAAATASPLPLLAAGGLPPGGEQVIESLRLPRQRRRALLFLGASSGATLAADLALIGDDKLLGDIAARLIARTSEEAAASDERSGESEDREWKRRPGGLAWLLETTSLELMAERLEESGVSRDLDAILTRYAGQAGRVASALERVLAQTSGLEQLREAIERENMVFLADTSPAARARAHSWLKARNLETPGYDPLASVEERRNALRDAIGTERSPLTVGGNER